MGRRRDRGQGFIDSIRLKEGRRAGDGKRRQKNQSESGSKFPGRRIRGANKIEKLRTFICKFNNANGFWASFAIRKIADCLGNYRFPTLSVRNEYFLKIPFISWENMSRSHPDRLLQWDFPPLLSYEGRCVTQNEDSWSAWSTGLSKSLRDSIGQSFYYVKVHSIYSQLLGTIVAHWLKDCILLDKYVYDKYN